jgi:hypothetical protein
MTAEFLEPLRREAEARQQEEAAYRQESRRQLEQLETRRARAYRRLNFLTDLVGAAANAANAEAAIAAQLVLAAAETGWSEARAGYDELREHLRPVATAIQAAVEPAEEARSPAPDPAAALAKLEAWYREKFGQDFLDLLGRPAPTFQPLVDF